MDNVFTQISERSRFWAGAKPELDIIVSLGISIHKGESPEITPRIEGFITPLRKDTLLMRSALPSYFLFWVTTVWAYYTGEKLITMRQLAQGLVYARKNKAKSFELDDNAPKPTEAQQTYASNWIKTKGILVYIDPTERNPRRANRVIYSDAIWALHNSKDE